MANRTKADSANNEQRRRDKMLRRLLNTPPQPRPKRERGQKKPTRTRASRASAKKP